MGESPADAVRSAFAAALSPEIRSSVMTTADMLRAEGRAEGQLEARRECLLELLEARFGAVDAATRARIQSASNEQLAGWLRRFAVARSFEEVFASG